MAERFEAWRERKDARNELEGRGLGRGSKRGGSRGLGGQRGGGRGFSSDDYWN